MWNLCGIGVEFVRNWYGIGVHLVLQINVNENVFLWNQYGIGVELVRNYYKSVN